MSHLIEKIENEIRKKIYIYLHFFENPIKKTMLSFSKAEEKKEESFKRYLNDALFYNKVNILLDEIMIVIKKEKV